MLENECKIFDIKKFDNTKINTKDSIYACFNENANKILNQCFSSIYVSNFLLLFKNYLIFF